MKLREWLPSSFDQNIDKKAAKHLDQEITEEYRCFELAMGEKKKQQFKPWIGTHRHVYNWVVLANGYAVAFNENPTSGVSFPVVKIKGGKQ